MGLNLMNHIARRLRQKSETPDNNLGYELKVQFRTPIFDFCRSHLARVSLHFREVIAQPNQWPDPLMDYPFIVLENVPANNERILG